MKKSSLLLFSLLFFVSCAELQDIVGNMPSNGPLTQTDIASGLKAALNQGIDKQVSQLAAENGFFDNQLTRIALPKELQKVEKGLRAVGLGNLADEGIKALNKTASDAVGRATPIFVNAIKEMTFADAKNILMGDELAATSYLEGKTTQRLYNEFNPVIKSSFSRVGADKIWSDLIQKYNSLPLVEPVNPDLTDYVTGQALNGVYKMIGVEEKKIRTDISARSSVLLKRVFALQDDKK